MSTTRRNFLGSGLAAGAAMPLAGPMGALTRKPNVGGFPTLVVIEAQGGWDYLNMIAETDHPIYQQVRPTIRLRRSATLQIESGMSQYWHPGLADFKALYDRNDLAIIHNVGHPNEDLSHFESLNKLRAGDPTVDTVRSGWLARYVQQFATSPVPALSIQSSRSEAFTGVNVPSFLDTYTYDLSSDWRTGSDSKTEIAAIKAGNADAAQSSDPSIREIGALTDYAIRVGAILDGVGSNYQPAVSYPDAPLARNLKLAARYISASLPVHVYYTSMEGFDTHASQVNVARTELGVMNDDLIRLSGSIRSFLDDMAAHGCGQDVVVMVISDFGRRVTQNGSIGTDHGHGGVAFLAGQPVRGGNYGQYPDLSRIHKPNESYHIPFDFQSTDFRSLYATVLERWLNVPSAPIFNGQQFPLLGAL